MAPGHTHSKGSEDDGDKLEEESSFYLPKKSDEATANVVTCVVVGGGLRGQCYSKYSKDFPHLLRIVAICDPSKRVRQIFEKEFNIPADRQFTDWNELMKLDKVADFACVCTPDVLHKDPAIALAGKGYHILLEKPMATTWADCIAIKDACERSNVMFAVCHVLRYYPPNKKLKELIDSGVIGDVVNIQHTEPVGFWHYAHSYVRGNWRKESESCFSLLAKCCHDVDLIAYWMRGQLDARKNPVVCTTISSFGSLIHFKKENKPEGALDRCLGCSVEEECPYSAQKIYLKPAKSGFWSFPVKAVTDIEDINVLTDRLQSGPYGRCVYDCDNDVCDNQIVNFQFSGGQTASLTMIAYTESVCKRRTIIYGTKGELTFDERAGPYIKQYNFATRRTTQHQCSMGLAKLSSMRGHGGADFYLMDSFVKAVMFNDRNVIASGADETLQSHLLCFSAEESRVKGKVIVL